MSTTSVSPSTEAAQCPRLRPAHGVTLKGTFPIGISRPVPTPGPIPRLFNLNSQAGAPPDDFSVLGQNWGLPTYNWEEMSRDGVSNGGKTVSARWQNTSTHTASTMYWAFFRIWQIPMDAIHGLLGSIQPRSFRSRPTNCVTTTTSGFDTDLHTTPYIMDYFVGDYSVLHRPKPARISWTPSDMAATVLKKTSTPAENRRLFCQTSSERKELAPVRRANRLGRQRAVHRRSVRKRQIPSTHLGTVHIYLPLAKRLRTLVLRPALQTTSTITATTISGTTKQCGTASSHRLQRHARLCRRSGHEFLPAFLP